MNALELLKQDHRTVRELFGSFDAAGDHAFSEKKTYAERIFHALDGHTQIEEEVFYPTVESAAAESLRDLVKEAFEEHRVAKTLISELRRMSPEAEEYDAKMKVLKENIEHHVEEEEGEMFPKIQETFSRKALEEIGDRMQARKRDLQGRQTSLGGTLVELVTSAVDSLTGSSSTRASRRGRATSSARPKHQTLTKAENRRNVSARSRKRSSKTAVGRTKKMTRAARRVGKRATKTTSRARKRATSNAARMMKGLRRTARSASTRAARVATRVRKGASRTATRTMKRVRGAARTAQATANKMTKGVRRRRARHGGRSRARG